MTKKKKWQSLLLTFLLFFAILPGMSVVFSAGTIYCSNASELNVALSNPACDVVVLTADINGHSGTVVNNPARSHNKIIDGQNHTISGNGKGYGFYFRGKTGITIRHCNISNFREGMYLINCDYFDIHHNSIHEHWRRGIYFLRGSKHNAVHNNTIYNNHYDGVRFGYYTNNDDDCEYNEANDNSIYNIDREGIDFSPGAHNGAARRNTIVKADWCINIGDKNGAANNIIIQDNILDLQTWSGGKQIGICIFKSCNNITISNNTISNETTSYVSPNMTIGIYLGYNASPMCTNVFLENNTIIDCDYDIYSVFAEGTNNGTNNTCNITYRYDDFGASSCTCRHSTRYLSDAYPINKTRSVPIQPTCSIKAIDHAGENVTTYWYENSTGTWVLRQTNNSFPANTTVRWNFIQASGMNTQYWWRVDLWKCCTMYDSAIFSFTTSQYPVQLFAIKR